KVVLIAAFAFLMGLLWGSYLPVLVNFRVKSLQSDNAALSQANSTLNQKLNALNALPGENALLRSQINQLQSQLAAAENLGDPNGQPPLPGPLLSEREATWVVRSYRTQFKEDWSEPIEIIAKDDNTFWLVFETPQQELAQL